MANKRFKVKAPPLAFLAPSGVQHQGHTYEDYYSQQQPTERALPLDYAPPDAAPQFGKGAPAAKKRPRHQHQWLIRHDYMQCRSCGKLVTIRKERGSVDQ